MPAGTPVVIARRVVRAGFPLLALWLTICGILALRAAIWIPHVFR